MAGGKGTRLQPLTSCLPKPMIPFFHKPLMQYSIEWLRSYNITDIAVTVQYLSNEIKQYFGDGTNFGTNLTYFEEHSPLGTAGSVKQAEALLRETFVVVSGDALTNFNLDEAIRFHHEKKATVTIIIHREPYSLEFGNVLTNKEGQITTFIEKPQWNEVRSDMVNTGIYICEPEIFDYISPNIIVDFGHDIFPGIVEDKKIYGFEGSGYWSDVGTIEQYRRTIFDVFRRKIDLDIFKDANDSSIKIGENVTIERDVSIKGPCFIGEGTIIRKGAKILPYTIIGKRIEIDEDAYIKRSILWDDVYVGKNCQLTGTIIANTAHIGRGSVIPANTVIGQQCIMQRNVKMEENINQWSDEHLEETIVQSTMVASKDVTKVLFTKKGIHGVPNVSITLEFLTKVALAFGTILDDRSSVIIGSDGHPYSMLVKNIVMNAIRSLTIHITDCTEKIAVPFLRHELKECLYSGGIYIYCDEETDEIILDILDEQGIPIDGKTQRKIENAIYQEQLRLPNLRGVGRSYEHINIVGLYIQSIIKTIRLSKNKHRIIVACPVWYEDVVKKICEKLHCEVTFLSLNTKKEVVREAVILRKVSFAIIISANGESYVIMDEHGEIVSEDGKLALYVMASILLSNTNVAIPVYGTASLDLVASRLGGQVERMGGQRHEWMQNNDLFHFCFDAFYTISQLLQLLNIEEISLSELILTVPSVHFLRSQVACPWSERGNVMRRLIEDMEGEEVELMDGVKVYHPAGGWTLIIPELDEPTITIYTHADNSLTAKETSTYYTEKIHQYQNV